MPRFWPRLLLHLLTLGVLVIALPQHRWPWAVLVCAAYLAGFFIAQLAAQPAFGSLGRALSAAAAVAWLVAFHADLQPSVALIGYGLLVAPPLVEEALRAPSARRALFALGGGAVAALCAILVAVQRGAWIDALLTLLTFGLLSGASSVFRSQELERGEALERYGALLGEYRGLKRLAAGSAEVARAEERLAVARRLHDSVGHRLTSLLLQLEVDRMNATSPAARTRAEDLKRLAQASLDETRAAVSALSEEDLAGMPAIIRLIHNLEVESAMQVEFTIGRGALSTQLDQAPAVAFYRAVQEALTNAMRHGASRRAKVSVTVPAGRLLRFEVENEVAGDVPEPRPGFGLTSMRERVEDAGGQLEVLLAHGRFVVRGSFPLQA